MKAVYIREFGGPENLEIREVPDPPKPAGSKVLVRVRAAGLNRADLLQRRGLYPPPAGYSPNIPGMEFAGEIVETGKDAKDLHAGDRVFGIVGGEAQAEFLIMEESHLAKIPDNLEFVEAAAVPEVFITAHDAIFTQAKLKPGESLLVHAVGSGVGLAALQLAKASSVKVFGTSRMADKLEKCRAFGLDEAIHTRDSIDFSEIIREKTNRAGVNVILDLVGAAYFEQNLLSLAAKGRMMLVGLTSGPKAEFDLGLALTKRVTLIGTTLRGRSAAEKADATRRFAEEVLPLFETGKGRPNVDKIFAIEDVQEAHRYLESNESFGKVILKF
jgi:NADPH2:quinone reductase